MVESVTSGMGGGAAAGDAAQSAQARLVQDAERLALALSQIGAQIGAGSSDAEASAMAEVDELRAELEAERAAHAELETRVHAIRERQETTLAVMEQQLATAEAEAARLKRANLDLIAHNTELLDAAGDPAPHLINGALRAELEALRAVRAAEAAELSAILRGLAPLIAAHAPSGGAARSADTTFNGEESDA